MKEVLEETGIDCEPEGVIAVLDGMRMGFTRIPLYSIVFLCRATGGDLQAHPLETRDVGWFAEDELPPMTVGRRPVGRARLRGDPRRAGRRAVRRGPRRTPGTRTRADAADGRGQLPGCSRRKRSTSSAMDSAGRAARAAGVVALLERAT